MADEIGAVALFAVGDGGEAQRAELFANLFHLIERAGSGEQRRLTVAVGGDLVLQVGRGGESLAAAVIVGIA